jgi:hypothetical protein
MKRVLGKHRFFEDALKWCKPNYLKRGYKLLDKIQDNARWSSRLFSILKFLRRRRKYNVKRDYSAQ